MVLTINEKLQVLRNRAGLTQKEMGRRVGVSQAFIAAVESGKREPRLEVLRRMADVLGYSVDLVIQSDNQHNTTL